MKKIRTEDAIGHVLCHDITQIVKDVKKGVAFRKGHIVTAEDIPILLSIGKEQLYIWENDESMLHENDAAEILYSMCANEGILPTEVKEGKIEAIAAYEGLLKVDVERLFELNKREEMMIATRNTHTVVKKGEKLAGMRVIPLLIEKEKMNQAKEAVGDAPLLTLVPFLKKKVGIVTTGSEVYKGRIKDSFGPVIRGKFEAYDTEILGQTIVDDKIEMIQDAIKAYIEKGADFIVCTGGMSVDPDDVTPTAIRDLGVDVVSYGAPVLPGAMLLLGYYGDIPILGLPGCVMYAKVTIFDLVLPRMMTGERLTKEDLARLGHGGLCTGCTPCHFPNCSFGKGF